MDEKILKDIISVLIIGLLICGIICALFEIINIFTGAFSIAEYEKNFKDEYQKYKPYLFDELELQLTHPQKLKIAVYSDTFTNNSELRHSFMQVAYTLRYLNDMEGTEIDPEIEAMFLEIRKVAYSNNENF